jgi:hypothetical protein
MAEVIFTFAEPFLAGDEAYAVRVCGRPAGTIWEGWLEFVAADGVPLATPRETTQPDRHALEYWATGLSETYFQGAFRRAVSAEEAAPREGDAAVVAPAPVGPAVSSGGSPFDQPAAAPGAVLDPFSVAEKGEELLRSELLALSDWHLRNIIRAYDLAEDDTELEALPAPALVELIVDAVTVA